MLSGRFAYLLATALPVSKVRIKTLFLTPEFKATERSPCKLNILFPLLGTDIDGREIAKAAK